MNLSVTLISNWIWVWHWSQDGFSVKLLEFAKCTDSPSLAPSWAPGVIQQSTGLRRAFNTILKEWSISINAIFHKKTSLTEDNSSGRLTRFHKRTLPSMRRLIFRPHPSHQSFLEHRNQDFLFGSVSPGIGTLLQQLSASQRSLPHFPQPKRTKSRRLLRWETNGACFANALTFSQDAQFNLVLSVTSFDKPFRLISEFSSSSKIFLTSECYREDPNCLKGKFKSVV